MFKVAGNFLNNKIIRGTLLGIWTGNWDWTSKVDEVKGCTPYFLPSSPPIGFQNGLGLKGS